MSVKTENIEFEESLFFAVFKFSDQAYQIITKEEISKHDFVKPEHKILFEEIEKLYKTQKSIPSLKAFYRYLVSSNDIDEATLVKLKISLKSLASKITEIKDLPLICKSLKKLFCIRQFLVSINKNLENLDNKNEVDDVLGSMEGDINKLRKKLNFENVRQVVLLKENIDKRIDYVKEIKTNPNKLGLIETSFENFDKHIPKIFPGSLCLYQARTNEGKSMFLMRTALHNFKLGAKVLIITIEMSASDYAFRIDSNLTKIEHKEFATGTISDNTAYLKLWKEKIINTGNNGEDLAIYWIPEDCTPSKIISTIESNPFKPDLIVVDYAGDMKAGIKGVPEYDARSHAEIYSKLKEIAGRFTGVVFSAQQVRRGLGKKKIDTESGSWSDVGAGKSDLIISIQETEEDSLYREVVDGEEIIKRLTLRITKGRNFKKNLITKIEPHFNIMMGREIHPSELQSNDRTSEELDKESKPIGSEDKGFQEDDITLPD